MRQEDILSKMTKGVWREQQATWSNEKGSVRSVDIQILDALGYPCKLIAAAIPANELDVRPTSQLDVEQALIDITAIALAVNATWGNGILPENIKPMADKLKKLEEENKILKEGIQTLYKSVSK